MERRWSVPVISGLVALLAAVLLAPGLGPVSGAIPENGTYSACLIKRTGAIKVINYPKVKCAKGQRLIKWNQRGPAGAPGATGPAGPQGPAGSAGITRISLTTVTADKTIPANVADTVIATCPAGSRVTGGGYINQSPNTVLLDSFPQGTGEWHVFVATGGTSAIVTAYAICMATEPSSVIAKASKKRR